MRVFHGHPSEMLTADKVLVTIGTPYLWEIVLPGSLVGLIVAYATFTYAGPQKQRA